MSFNIYTGFWVNWGKGRVFGATLTLPTHQGNLVIAFLALFIAFTGNHLWKIICFSIHQLRSTDAESDGLHQQIQTILPAGLTDLNMLWKFGRLAWAWRGKTKSVKRRTLMLLGVSILHFSVITVAGLFATKVVDTADEVLLRFSEDCGSLDNEFLSNVMDRDGIDLYQNFSAVDSLFLLGRTAITEAQRYAEACYPWMNKSERKISGSSCSAYVVPFLNSTIDPNAKCPFVDHVCGSPAISLDSGWIGSEEHLGINGPFSDQIHVRRRLTCSSVDLEEKYSPGWMESPFDPHNQIKPYYFGVSPGYTGPNNITLLFGNEGFLDAPVYAPIMFSRLVANLSDSTLEPIADFALNNADLIIVVQGKNVAYTNRIDDPVFDAQYQIPFNLTRSKMPAYLWVSKRSWSSYACSEQYQFCNSNLCTDLGGIHQLRNDNDTITRMLDLNTKQRVVYATIWRAVYLSRPVIFDIVLGSELLRAKEKIPLNNFRLKAISPLNESNPTGIYYFSSPVETQHWQIEVQALQNLALSLLQRLVVQHASPPDLPLSGGNSAKEYLLRSSDPVEKQICSSQKVKGVGYSSFSVFGLVFILVTGSFIVFLAYFIPSYVQRRQTRSGTAKSLYRKDDWNLRDILHLFRMVSENQNPGAWTDPDVDIPTMIGSETQLTWKPRSTKVEELIEQ